ncbi:ribosome hibernation-promoting factor, HPF/YfiA family [Actinocrispum wychmicini]|uniref:Ribosome hibernation promoting factor n=1 Tax=Actinocrispum wychmicini TaxID=1213861 RepID=A0A4R2K6X9_9PSEU|nr:ribosome-associated translation inhibitor RaiA [Actinocrispum wychmicini]TCO65699.1 ribosomal subunit interface protein [Actinocrispum wychmicini]
MDIVVKGRNVEVPDHYRVHVTDKLARLERYDKKVIRFDVELFHEPNRRQAKSCQRVEITAKSRGPVVRSEACAGDFYAALDSAVNKLENRLRRLHDRRRVHHGRRSPSSVAEATSSPEIGSVDAAPELRERNAMMTPQRSARTALLESPEFDGLSDDGIVPEQRWDSGLDEPMPGRVVREKEHPATPMSVDQALYQMELVGHDFYLFFDAEVGRPSVVYRRKGFDYGVIRMA